MTSVRLTDAQLDFLGSAPDLSDETIAAVERARLRIATEKRLSELPTAVARFIADILNEAKTEGRLIWSYSAATVGCRLCEKSPQPIRYTRGRNRGRVRDYTVVTMVEMARRFVTMRGYPTLACCKECAETWRDRIAAEVVAIPVQLPEPLSTPGAVRYLRYDNCKCRCGWEGHRGELTFGRTLMGDGWFRGGCPKCGNGDEPFSSNIDSRDGFVVVVPDQSVCVVCDQPGRAGRCRRHAEATA